jgi:hypothetical protein
MLRRLSFSTSNKTLGTTRVQSRMSRDKRVLKRLMFHVLKFNESGNDFMDNL